MSASLEVLAPEDINSGAMWPGVPPASTLVVPKEVVATIAQSPKSEIHARGGVSLVIRILACNTKRVNGVGADRRTRKRQDNREINAPLLGLRG